MESSSWQVMLDHLTKAAKRSVELPNLKSAKTNAERVSLCSKQTMVKKMLDEWLSHFKLSPTNQKDSRSALKLKARGNKAYVEKDMSQAMKFYNKALMICPEGEISLLYGNRSAVLFDEGLWEKCLIDVDVAISKGFPGEKLWKLYKRKGEALLKLNRTNDSILSFEKCLQVLADNEKLTKERDLVTKLLHNAKDSANVDVINQQICELSINQPKSIPIRGYSDKVTSVSKSVSLCQSDSVGRYLVANEDIDDRSVVLVEKPYASVLLPEWFQSHCQHCFDKVNTLYPCKQCTEVCYCSVECQEESWELYHKFECGKLNLMAEIGVAHLALRIILVSDIESLSMFFDDSTIESHEIIGCNFNGIYESNYESIYHLMTHSEDIQLEDLFQYTVASLLLLNILDKSHYFSDNTSEYTQFQIGGLLLRHILQIVCNAHAITSIESTLDISDNVVEQDQVRIATALYATGSLLNHSCMPNILNTFHKDKLIVKTLMTIEKGQQIFTCYGPHYRRMDFGERQNTLKSQYCFVCKCKACFHGLKAMEEFDCFRCPNCSKNIYTKNTNCTHCGKSLELVIPSYNEKSAEANKKYREGINLMNKKRKNIDIQKFETALRKLSGSESIQQKIYSQYHSSLGKTYDTIAKCNSLLYRYPEAIFYIKKSVEIIGVHYGKKSIEVTNEYLKLSDLYIALMQFLIDADEYDNIVKYLPEAIRDVEYCIDLLLINQIPDSSDMLDMRCKYDTLTQLRYLSDVSNDT